MHSAEALKTCRIIQTAGHFTSISTQKQSVLQVEGQAIEKGATAL